MHIEVGKVLPSACHQWVKHQWICLGMGQGKGEEGWTDLLGKLSLHSISLVGWEYSKRKANSFLGQGVCGSCFSLRNKDPPHFRECEQVRGTCEAWWTKADVSLTHRRWKVQQQAGMLAVWLFSPKRSLSSGHYLQASFLEVQGMSLVCPGMSPRRHHIMFLPT